jgi:antitoxin VapB
MLPQGASAMGITIDNPRAHELASELAALTGESLDRAVTKAIEERLERERKRREDIEALREIAKRFKEAAPPGLTSDHSFLYDEYGLPK